ncbi:MAG: hypothetical protein ACOYVJ_06590 [Nitrospirota bacterium]
MKFNHSDRKNLSIAFLAGGIVGAGVFRFFAAHKVKERISNLTEDLRELTTGSIAGVKKQMTAEVEKGVNLIKDEREALSTARDAGKQAYKVSRKL